MAHTASNPIRAYFVINFDLSARKRLQSVVLRYFMQASRVNGLTSGVFAFLVPASCLNQKGSDTRRNITTSPPTHHSPPFPGFYYENAGDGENWLFPVPCVGQLSNAKASAHRHSGDSLRMSGYQRCSLYPLYSLILQNTGPSHFFEMSTE